LAGGVLGLAFEPSRASRRNPAGAIYALNCKTGLRPDRSAQSFKYIRWALHGKRLMRSLGIELVHEGVEAVLLLQAV
jgi:hypothetical protein